MLNLLFLMMLAGIYFLIFSGKIRHQKKKINQIIYILNTGFLNPSFQDSIILRLAADERSELSSRMGRVNWLSCRHVICFLTIVVLVDFVPSH